MGPQSAPERYQNKGIFTRLLDGLEIAAQNHLFCLCILHFLANFPFLGQKSTSGSKTLNPVRTPGCGFRCFSWKIASRNHQYSLGLTWYFERGDDGKSDSKRTKKRQCLCRAFHAFPRKPENIIGKVSMKFGHVSILGAFSWKSHKISWKWDSKNQWFRDFCSFEKL